MIIVMGLPGAGKTTVLTKAAEQKSEYEILNYGTLMFEIAKEKYGLENRDEIRKLNAEQQKEVQALVGKKLSEEKGKVILDTHCSVLNPDKNFYLPGLPYSLLKDLDVNMLVLITGEINELAERRKKDTSRVRAVDPEEIREHDQINRMYLASYSALTGAPAKIIINRNGKLEDAVKELVGVL
ncbi:adenylate kinase [Candidatus Micrarchaeota archaeon]|nr:adenylate kinase [Candidatus Micrarchaeota archaeon]